ncbi:hypothetical protein KSP39_PZI008460 [Platanthera zijinensis]|uniref:HMA domain-containing protein n=1 Tax=Platanthera zijinensis TaxID=2320716 RepID=A0AAP0BMM5_9ASPA
MEQLIITAVYKLHLHCKECARAVHKSITSAPGILKVDIDMESGKVTVKGIFDAKKLHEIIEKKSKRKVEWLSPKPVEGVESVKMDMKGQSCAVVGVVEEKKLLKYIHKKTGKRGKIIEQKQEKDEAKEEPKLELEVPKYFIHCSHAPQWFSDENPNACSLM